MESKPVAPHKGSQLRIHFRDRPDDVLVALGYTGLVSLGLLLFGTGSLLAIPLVFFVPGYLLAAVLFPMKNVIGWPSRLALSFGLSFSSLPMLVQLLTLASVPLTFVSIVSTTAAFVALICPLAIWRRMCLPPEARLSITLDVPLLKLEEASRLDHLATVAFVIGIAVAAGSVAYVMVAPPASERFTEFYLLGPGNNASSYPTSLHPSESGLVVLGIVDHESKAVTYTVQIELVGRQVVYNATSGLNDTLDVNHTILSTFNVTLADGQNWTQRYLFRINYTGLWKIHFLLFKDADFSTPYRQLRMFVRIS